MGGGGWYQEFVRVHFVIAQCVEGIAFSGHSITFLPIKFSFFFPVIFKGQVVGRAPAPQRCVGESCTTWKVPPPPIFEGIESWPFSGGCSASDVWN